MLSRVMMALSGLILVLECLPCLAGPPDNVTELEFTLAPPYCRNRMGPDAFNWTGTETAHWESVLGGHQNIAPIHHYCWALINLTRAERGPIPPGSPTNYRALMMEYAIGDIDYVLKNARPDFKLLPEIYTARANVLVKLKRYSEAVNDFRKAAQAKQDYWPAYAGLAEFYRFNKQLDEARAVVEEGLTYTPESKTLNSMLADLQKSGAKPGSRKQPSTQNKVPSNPPPPTAQEPTPQDSAQQPEPSPAK